MNTSSQRPASMILALVLTAACWIPTLSSPAAAQPAPSAPIVYATSASMVMM